LINVHTPTKSRRDKRRILNLLEQNIYQVTNSDINIRLEYFNAKVGEENTHKPTIGNENSIMKLTTTE
jgi:hypothetical protein